MAFRQCFAGIILVLAWTFSAALSSISPPSLKTGTVVVAGASGRVGQLVVKELLTFPNSTVSVTAAVRDTSKAKTIFKDILSSSDRLKIVKCDLADAAQMEKACDGADAAIWCASGFSDRSNFVNRALALFKLTFSPKDYLEIAAIKKLGEIFAGKENTLCEGGPQVILCSSAGVTRPAWSEEKKEKFVGAADIPIVRLNPFKILDIKAEGEQALRDTGVPYCVVRPCGLNDKWPNGRPIISQGDMAVGRINRNDVASLLVSMLFETKATGKTFEAIAQANYPKPRTYDLQLSRLLLDGEEMSDAALEATYSILQQLVPGETLQPNQLAMGQTYEQLDKGEVGRLGKRGEEQAPIVQEN
mmetsp:Transcript_21885/g.28669  ORF Transcript_21885/g.28669 Transcript_21885/m.28669 type:complete len:359 (-) Transcript_21885:194-1270(-)